MKFRFKRFIRILTLTLSIVFIAGFLFPEDGQMPVEGATSADYHPETYWYYPWGRSGTHKGVDVFAKSGTPIHPNVGGVVLATGEKGDGGKYVLILGPK